MDVSKTKEVFFSADLVANDWQKDEDPWRQISRKEYLARKEHSKNAKKNKVQNATSK